ncbi:Ank2 [Symbiodinium pilosum]|uniref:Ank2 protein n=1 Tax=Symbiodinium pilosum TaxID=2952 RepID=A0A812SDF8_SYMPI|nr:Ank2 [Symbiodinium pilosum]
MVCTMYGPSTTELAALLSSLQQQSTLSSMPMPAFIPVQASQDPLSVSLSQIVPYADCNWRTDEVAFVATGKDEADSEKTQALACEVPSLVRQAAKGNLEEVRNLLDGGEDPDITDDLGLTALHGAAKKGHSKIVALLLARGARVNPAAAKWKGETPLHYACKYGHAKILQMLLSSGADPAVLTQEGRSALDFAKEKRHLNCVDLLCGATSQSYTVRL